MGDGGPREESPGGRGSLTGGPGGLGAGRGFRPLDQEPAPGASGHTCCLPRTI